MFIVIERKDRYILYMKTAKTYELLCAVSNKDTMEQALRNLCAKFRGNKIALERYVRNYESLSTRSGMIFTKFNHMIEEEWTSTFAPIWKARIEGILDKCLNIKSGVRRKKFKVMYK